MLDHLDADHCWKRAILGVQVFVGGADDVMSLGIPPLCFSYPCPVGIDSNHGVALGLEKPVQGTVSASQVEYRAGPMAIRQTVSQNLQQRRHQIGLRIGREVDRRRGTGLRARFHRHT